MLAKNFSGRNEGSFRVHNQPSKAQKSPSPNINPTLRVKLKYVSPGRPSKAFRAFLIIRSCRFDFNQLHANALNLNRLVRLEGERDVYAVAAGA